MLSILQFSTRLFIALSLGAAIGEVSWKVIGEENDL
jgi:hypothetical protein